MKTIMRYYPITVTFVLICGVIAIINLLLFKKINFSNESVIKLGGLDKELINDGQVWRLFSYAFGHMSLIHFLVNIPIIIILSRWLERCLGSVKFLLLLLVTTIGGGISIYYFYQGTNAIAGSSGPGFGFIGVLTFFLLRYPENLSSNDKQFILMLIVVGIISTFAVPGIAISSHVGGFISGVVIAFIFTFFKGHYNLSQGTK